MIPLTPTYHKPYKWLWCEIIKNKELRGRIVDTFRRADQRQKSAANQPPNMTCGRNLNDIPQSAHGNHT